MCRVSVVSSLRQAQGPPFEKIINGDSFICFPPFTNRDLLVNLKEMMIVVYLSIETNSWTIGTKLNKRKDWKKYDLWINMNA